MRQVILFVCAVLTGLMSMSQTVSNARFEQEGKTIKIYYDLTSQADISIYLSTDGGRSFEPQPLTHVSGAVGRGVAAGSGRVAVWDVLSDREQLRGERICFKVRASQRQASSSQQGSNLVFTIGGVSFTMVHVQGGTFTMGATSEQGSEYDSDERPTHSVTLSPYYIGETEVTQGLWEAVMGSNPSHFSKGDDYPVERVTYDDCIEFCQKLSQKTGRAFTLPTEAQWEYAARGGHKRPGQTKYAGSNTLSAVAWYEEDFDSGSTHPVKGKQPNALGLYDMSGNVWEWCLDWYGGYSSASQTNPSGPASERIRVVRSSSWINGAWCCRVSYRSNFVPSYRADDGGLRLVLLP